MSKDRVTLACFSRRGWLQAGAAVAAASLLPSARAAHVARAWPEGKPTPRLDLADLDGRPWSLSAQGGKVVLLNFWATWCEPCRAEMPSLEALAQRHERDGLSVVAVNYRESPLSIRRYLRLQPLSLPVLLDTDGAAAAAWTPRVFPSTVLVDRAGRARQLVIGELDWSGATARDMVEPLLSRTAKTGAR